MADERPDFSLESVPGERGLEKPALFLVRYFQVKEAYYLKPPMAEQLLEPDGEPAPTASGVVATQACACNAVCTCVPVSTCACNTVCACNMVNRTYGVSVAMGNTTDGKVSVAPGSSKVGVLEDLSGWRTWTDCNGKTVRGQFVRIHEHKVILKVGAGVLQVPSDELSTADQQLLRAHGHQVVSSASAPSVGSITHRGRGFSRSTGGHRYGGTSGGRSCYGGGCGHSIGGGSGGYWAPCF